MRTTQRRTIKRPGRQPQSAKRARFMELRARGWGLKTIAKEIGISRSTAKRWHRGTKQYRNGQTIEVAPPLNRLAARIISDRYLSQDERILIADVGIG